MKGHIHTDIVTALSGSVMVMATAHVMRMLAAYISTHGMKTLGTAVGAFFSLPGKA